MNIDDEGKRCFEEEELSPKGFFLSRRHSDSMDVEQEVSTMEYSWEMTVSDREKASQRKEMSQENFEDELEVKDILVNKRLNEKMRYEKGKEMRRKISEEKSVAKKGAEAKLSTTVTVKVKREVSAKSLSSEKKTRVSKSPRVRKSPSHSPMRTTGSVVDSDISMKRSPSPKGAKHLKAHESPLNDRQKNMKVKPSSLSPTSSDKSEQLTSTTKLTGSKFVRGNRLKEETSENVVTRVKENVDTKLEEGKGSTELLRTERKKKIVLDFSEFPPPKSERKGHARMHPDFLNVPEPGFYLSPIEENSEASTISGQSKIVSESHGKSVEAPMEYDHTRKYHTYPKSRIPVARWSKEQRFGNFMMDPKMYPLEPREIDLEAFQQLHTADSQEELQEFLLLESQCSGNLGLAGNMSTSEVSCDEHHSEDERGTMSGTVVDLLTV